MPTVMSSRELNQDVSSAKRAAASGPVFITHRGRPSHVPLSLEEYCRLTGDHVDIIDMLAMPGVEDIEFDPPRLQGALHRPAKMD